MGAPPIVCPPFLVFTDLLRKSEVKKYFLRRRLFRWEVVRHRAFSFESWGEEETVVKLFFSKDAAVAYLVRLAIEGESVQL